MLEAFVSVLLLGLVPAESPTSLVSSLPDVAPPAHPIVVSDRLSASGVVIFDAKSGQELYAQQSLVRRPMASLTKLMTAVITIENHDLDEIVTVPRDVEDVEGNKAYLPVGERFRVGDLLSALLISSANDAAYTLALHHSETVGDFVEEMNTRAEVLGLGSTSFANPAGLDHPQQYSTPRDIALLTSFALRQDDIAERMARRGRRIVSLQGTPIDLTHTHALLHANTGVLAGKTGTTDGAGQCLSSLVSQEDRQYLVVLMNSANRYADMRKILAVLSTDSAIPEKTPDIVAVQENEGG